jgi:hypothetical protein
MSDPQLRAIDVPAFGPCSAMEFLQHNLATPIAAFRPKSQKTLRKALKYCAELLEFSSPSVVEIGEHGLTTTRGPLLRFPLSRDRQLFLFVTNTGQTLLIIADWRRMATPKVPDELPRAGFWGPIYDAIKKQKEKGRALSVLTAMIGESNKAAMLEQIEEFRREGSTPAICALVGRNNDGTYPGICAVLALPPPIDLVIRRGEGNA